MKEAVDSACTLFLWCAISWNVVANNVTRNLTLSLVIKLLLPIVKAYMDDPEHMLFAIGSTVGPHPFPMMVRDFQAIVGFEAKEQFQELTGGAPDILLACVTDT